MKTILSSVAIALGAIEATGFVAYWRYCYLIGQPLHLDSIPIVQLPTYSLQAYAAQAQATMVFVELIVGISILLWIFGRLDRTQRRYRSIVIDRNRPTTSWWYHFRHSWDFTDFPSAIRAAVTCILAAVLLSFAVFSCAVAWSRGTVLAQESEHGAQAGQSDGVVRLVPIHLFFLASDSKQMPPQLLKANDQNDLTLVNDTPDSYAIAVRSSTKVSGSIYWVDRKSVASLEFIYPPEAAKSVRERPAKPASSVLLTILNLFLAVFILAVAGALAWLLSRLIRQRLRQHGALYSFDPSRIELLDLPSTDLIEIFSTLTRGVDVDLKIVQGKEERCYYLRASIYQSLELKISGK